MGLGNEEADWAAEGREEWVVQCCQCMREVRSKKKKKPDR